jgi:signal transduction histidine kinase
MFSHRQSRPYTTAVLDAVDEGMLDKDTLIADLLGWLSESEVEQFARANDLLVAIRMEDEDEYDGQPDEAQEWADFDPDC